MISFEVKLTVNQISCMRAIRTIMETGKFSTNGAGHWFQGTNYLFRENLIEVIKRAPTEEEITNRALVNTDGMIREWRLTRKGLLLLEVVELEIVDAQAYISKSKDVLKRDIATNDSMNLISESNEQGDAQSN